MFYNNSLYYSKTNTRSFKFIISMKAAPTNNQEPAASPVITANRTIFRPATC